MGGMIIWLRGSNTSSGFGFAWFEVEGTGLAYGLALANTGTKVGAIEAWLYEG